MYTENDLVRLAKRENNNKRSYLVVNRLQGKHIPAVPSKTLNMFEQLAAKVRLQYAGERLLLIGFAETATAIGAALAVSLDCKYIQTTREEIDEVSWFYFSESHSHATEQKLVKDDIDQAVRTVDRIVFVEDEVTTGNTILGIVRLIRAEYQENIKFGVASLLNGMNGEAVSEYQKQDIDIVWLVKTEHDTYDQRVAGVETDGRYVKDVVIEDAAAYQIVSFDQYQNARRLVEGRAYGMACDGLWNQIRDRLALRSNQRILVLGTEEFMYPALYAAWQMEQMGNWVRFHATTRSPIAVSASEDYPLHTRYELKSVYDNERTTYLYDLDSYDKVFIITDSHAETAGCADIVRALQACRNDHIIAVRWC